MAAKHTEKLIASGNFYLKLITSKDAEGRAFYAYLMIDGNKLHQFENELNNKSLNLEEWGRVIHSGYGTPAKHEMELITKLFQTYAGQ